MSKLFNSTEIEAVMRGLPKGLRALVWIKNFEGRERDMSRTWTIDRWPRL